MEMNIDNELIVEPYISVTLPFPFHCSNLLTCVVVVLQMFINVPDVDHNFGVEGKYMQ